jgi:NADH-quinone oxidoreductase subunit N
MIPSDVIFLLPEIIVCLGGLMLLVVPLVITPRQEEGTVAKWSVLGLLALTTVALFYVYYGVPGARISEMLLAMFAMDAFAFFFKLLFTGAVAMVVLLSKDYLREERYSAWEYYALIIFALTGMFFMASGVHLISIYIGLELLSLSSYILAGYYKNEAKSTEAAMKYFVLGSVSSGILLYGISLIYGVCGSLRLSEIEAALATMVENDALIIGIMLLGAGLCFKVAAVPFHVWTPDVYVGAPTPITAFLSTASKAAAFAIFARIFYSSFSAFRLDWGMILAVVAALSMIGGNLAAITQANVKRMLAYSSIGHAGYALMGIIAMNELGLNAVLIYMLVYVFANTGIWTTVLILRRHEYAGESVDDFEGLHARAPVWAFAMVVFLLSLGGIPPTAGFIGKYYLFASAVQSGYGWLAIIAVLMSAVSMFYYLRLVVAMYLREGRQAEIAVTPALKLVMVVCLVATLAIGILPERVLRGISGSAGSVVTTVARR